MIIFRTQIWPKEAPPLELKSPPPPWKKLRGPEPPMSTMQRCAEACSLLPGWRNYRAADSTHPVGTVHLLYRTSSSSFSSFPSVHSSVLNDDIPRWFTKAAAALKRGPLLLEILPGDVLSGLAVEYWGHPLATRSSQPFLRSLKPALCFLKNSPHTWYKKRCSSMTAAGCRHEQSFYDNGQIVILKNYFWVFLRIEIWQNSILSRCSAISSPSKYTTHYI